MTRQTTLSLLAAAAFGVIMAAASSASGEAPQGGQAPTQTNNSCGYVGCMARCAPPGATPEQRARCQSQCMAQNDPMDCQYLRRPTTAAAADSIQGATPRRR